MRYFLILCGFFSISTSYAANCDEQQTQALQEVLDQFFKKYEAEPIEIEVINFNCYVTNPKVKPWDSNVAVIYTKQIKNLPFSDPEIACNYWTHQKKGHIRSSIPYVSTVPNK